MSERRLYRAGTAGIACAGALLAVMLIIPVNAQMPPHPHQRSKASLNSTERCEYRITQNKEERGRETIEKRVFDNNTVEFVIDASMAYGSGVTMSQRIEMSLEEESFFPRAVHIVKTVMQPDSSKFEHSIDIDMVSNVAVVSSKLNGKGESRRVVVPIGIPVAEVGILGYHYQFLFWYDRGVGGAQRFQWLDPVTTDLNAGELKLEKEETIPVLGKKTKVSVFNFDREKIGAATLWVDKDGVIVRGEQNFMVYELLGRKKS